MQDVRTRYQLSQPGKYNAVEIKEPLSTYEMMSGLLIPLYASRAAEESFFGSAGVTLSTANEVSSVAGWIAPASQVGHTY